MDALFTVAVNAQGHVCGSHVLGEGALEPSALLKVLQTAAQIGKTMIQQLDGALEQEKRAQRPVGGLFNF